MSPLEIMRTAIANTFRSKLRTTLTVLAIFVGAFTLTLTNGIGTGISNYIDSQVDSIGASDVLMITAESQSSGSGFGPSSGGPREYDPEADTLAAQSGLQLEALTEEDLEFFASIEGIVSVEPLRPVSPDYIYWNDGTKYELTVNPTPIGSDLELLHGSGFSGEGAREIILPYAYAEALGFPSPEEAVGETVIIGVSDATGEQHEVEATVAGIQGDSVVGIGAGVSKGLADALYEVQTTGLPAAFTSMYLGAVARFDPTATADEVAAIKAELSEAGFTAFTVEDQLGVVQTIITAIVGVLNAFAVIALIAAGFGIINTLLMSVQERTREIGLMKALGMGGGRIFALFSTEAVFIGLLGSAIGSVVAIVLGTAISNSLAQGILSDLTGLRLISFDVASIGLVILLIMGLAFLAGTLPASRAASQNPIDALRYE